MKKRIPILILILACVGGGIWFYLKPDAGNPDILKGNGRIEATEIDIATKLAGRLEEVLVNEGDFVSEGQVLAKIQVVSLKAQLAEAQAQQRQAVSAVVTAEAQVVARRSDKLAAEAAVAQRDSELVAANQRLDRSENLSAGGAVAKQILDDDRAKANSSVAAISAAKAQVAAVEAAIKAAEAEVSGAKSMVEAALASIARIESDIDDCTLRSPRNGRVQYRIAQVGEVLGVGGKVLNLVDLADVYMTFFLPETVAGRVAIGSEVRLVIDAAPGRVIPAKVSYVASVAQFTPKTVETESERQKLMFRVKAQIDPALLQKHLQQVKTGLPGIAYLNIGDPSGWPADLSVNVPQ